MSVAYVDRSSANVFGALSCRILSYSTLSNENGFVYEVLRMYSKSLLCMNADGSGGGKSLMKDTTLLSSKSR